MKVTVKVLRQYNVWEEAKVEIDVEEGASKTEIYELASDKAELFMGNWIEVEKTFLDEEYEILEEDEDIWPDNYFGSDMEY